MIDTLVVEQATQPQKRHPLPSHKPARIYGTTGTWVVADDPPWRRPSHEHQQKLQKWEGNFVKIKSAFVKSAVREAFRAEAGTKAQPIFGGHVTKPPS